MASLNPPASAARTPRSICLFRLSAIGDVAHAVALVRTLQSASPPPQITWIVGEVEAQVARLVPGIEVIAVNKRRGLQEFFRLRRLLAGRCFEALLHMQVSFRSNWLSLAVPARRRIGFDAARSKEGHGAVVRERITPAPAPGEHVVDGFMRFAAAVGVTTPVYRWDLQLPPEALEWAQHAVPSAAPLLLINVCASRPVKDWRPEGFAAVVQHAVRAHQFTVALCGARSEHERAMADAIKSAAGAPVVDLVGRTSLPQLLALLGRAVVLVSPDSGPVHLATAMGTPVIGLYGATNLQRCGPYVGPQWSVDVRARAAEKLQRRQAHDLGWAEVVPGGMDLIEAADVCDRLDALLRQRRPA